MPDYVSTSHSRLWPFELNYRNFWRNDSQADTNISDRDFRLQSFTAKGTRLRGRRAGTRVNERELCHRNIIESFVTHRWRHNLSSLSKGVNKSNLIEIHPQPTTIKEKALSMAVINCRSLNKNGFKLKDHIVELDCDMIAITETWLPCEDIVAKQIIGDACPKGYKLSHVPRSNGRRGGGVGLLYKISLEVRCPEITTKYDSFEYSQHLVKVNSDWLRIVTVYRPPPSGSNGLTAQQFFLEFASFLEHLISLPGKIIISGDLNFHLEDTSNIHTREFLDILEVFSLIQHVKQPTHKHGHTLDCIITEQNANIVTNITVYTPWISDHSLLHFDLSVSKPVLTHESVNTRNWKSLDLENFTDDINNADFGTVTSSVTDCADSYYNILKSLIDNQVPIRTKTISVRPRAPWFTKELGREKREKRRLERHYRRTGNNEDAKRFKDHCTFYCKLLSTARESFYNGMVEENSGNQKALFSVINKLLHRNSEVQLPVFDDLNELTNRFADFFVKKVHNIRLGLDESSDADLVYTQPLAACELAVFKTVTPEDIDNMIKRNNNKCCSLDPIPTWLLKRCLTPLLPTITNIVNLSLQSIMPSSYKQAILTPVLKKPDLNTEELKNYRPISNLSFISKLIEKVVAKQITEHLSLNGLHETMQSAYRSFHSTETALCRIHNDILWAMDNNKAVLFVSLDLSAAFDTIDHRILLQRLEHSYGISGDCLNWFRSYLEGRTLKVLINEVYSEPKDLHYGVPQGSVLGPKLFTMYLNPLGNIVRRHGVQFHAYADDCQLYITLTKENSPLIKSKMETLLLEIKRWTSINKLKLNEDKSDVIALEGPRRTPVDIPSVTIGNEVVPVSQSVRLLGVDMDRNMTLKGHICCVAKKCFAILRNMFKIRHCLNKAAAKAMVHTMITSHIDYCNILLYGLPQSALLYLSKIQKMAARFISQRAKYDHISSVLKDLHWLPIAQRIEYKVLVMTFKALNGQSPQYINDLLLKRPPKRTRADNNNDLVIPTIKRSTFGGRSFQYVGPKLWNSLPKELKTCTDLNKFQKNLKTYLFKKAYPDVKLTF